MSWCVLGCAAAQPFAEGEDLAAFSGTWLRGGGPGFAGPSLRVDEAFVEALGWSDGGVGPEGVGEEGAAFGVGLVVAAISIAYWGECWVVDKGLVPWCFRDQSKLPTYV